MQHTMHVLGNKNKYPKVKCAPIGFHRVIHNPLLPVIMQSQPYPEAMVLDLRARASEIP
jgi:hypothetical protein